jgi:hypothetical protein
MVGALEYLTPADQDWCYCSIRQLVCNTRIHLASLNSSITWMLWIFCLIQSQSVGKAFENIEEGHFPAFVA